MQSANSVSISRSLIALAFLNFFLADARDGLGPFLDAFLATRGWSPATLGIVAMLGGILGMVATPLFGALVDCSKHKRVLIVIPVMLVSAGALWTLVSPDYFSVFGGQSLTAVVGAVIGPALMGLTLGLVGEKKFPDQVARNEFWNHAGNVASIAAIYAAVVTFGDKGVIGLMIVTATAAVLAALAIDPKEIDDDVARGLTHEKGDDREGPSGYAVLFENKGLLLLAATLLIFHFGNAPMSRLIGQNFSIQLGTPFRTTAIIVGVAQVTMIAAALAAPYLIKRFGLGSVFIIALCALPVRGGDCRDIHRFCIDISRSDFGRNRRGPHRNCNTHRGGAHPVGNRTLQCRPRRRDDGAGHWRVAQQCRCRLAHPCWWLRSRLLGAWRRCAAGNFVVPLRRVIDRAADTQIQGSQDRRNCRKTG